MKTVVITGGSRGIGAAAVARFAERGDRVYFLYEKDHASAAAVSEKTGAVAICCDVSDGQAVRAAFSKLPEVDILICCARSTSNHGAAAAKCSCSTAATSPFS